MGTGFQIEVCKARKRGSIQVRLSFPLWSLQMELEYGIELQIENCGLCHGT